MLQETLWQLRWKVRFWNVRTPKHQHILTTAEAGQRNTGYINFRWLNTSLYLVVSVLVISWSISLPKTTVLEEYIEKMETLSVEWLWKMNGGKWQEPGDTQQVTDKILTFCFLPLHARSSSLQSCSLPYCVGLFGW